MEPKGVKGCKTVKKKAFRGEAHTHIQKQKKKPYSTNGLDHLYRRRKTVSYA